MSRFLPLVVVLASVGIVWGSLNAWQRQEFPAVECDGSKGTFDDLTCGHTNFAHRDGVDFPEGKGSGLAGLLMFQLAVWSFITRSRRVLAGAAVFGLIATINAGELIFKTQDYLTWYGAPLVLGLAITAQAVSALAFRPESPKPSGSP